MMALLVILALVSRSRTLSSLLLTPNIASDLIMSRAKAVEAAVFVQFGVVDAGYKGKIRSLFVNLKDKGNPSLRENIVSGDLSAERFSKMTSEVW